MNASPVLSMRFAADLGALPSVRRAMRRWLESLGVVGPAADDIVLASWEACANAVEHPLDAAERDLCIDARAGSSLVCVLVRDAGSWRERAAPPYRGLGLTLVNAVMDDVAIIHGEEGTIVRMCRCLERGPRPVSTSRSTTPIGAGRVSGRFRDCRDPESASADSGSAKRA